MSLYLPAAIVETFVFFFATFIVIMLFKKYRERRKPAALALATAFTFWEIAIICLMVMRYVTYVAVDLHLIDDSINYAGIGINLGYLFSAVSNVLILTFVAIVFSQSPFFRSTGMFLPFSFGILNGVTVGLLISNLIRNPLTPEYSMTITLYHVMLTFVSFSALIIFTVKPLRQATFKWEKVGFRFIIGSGVVGILIYVSFAVDNIIPIDYSAFFYLAYAFAILMLIFAYIGYVMPNFIRKRLQEPM